MNYYFAYGSNMNEEQMKERCPESRFISKALLPNYKIDFTIYSRKRQCGCADIVFAPNQEVWGLLYEVSDKDMESLDRHEGHPNNYRRCEVEVTDEVGNKYMAISYEVVKKDDMTLKTSKHYLGLLQDAAKEHDFPETYQETLRLFVTSD